MQVGTFLSLHMTGCFIGVFFTCGFKVRDKAQRKLTEVKRENDWGMGETGKGSLCLENSSWHNSSELTRAFGSREKKKTKCRLNV